MVTVNDQLSIRLSTLITIENYKQIQIFIDHSHVLKRLVSTVRFCPSAPYNRYSRTHSISECVRPSPARALPGCPPDSKWSPQQDSDKSSCGPFDRDSLLVTHPAIPYGQCMRNFSSTARSISHSSIETPPTGLRFDNGTIECALRQTKTFALISDHNLLARQATRDTDLTKTRRSLLV